MWYQRIPINVFVRIGWLTEEQKNEERKFYLAFGGTCVMSPCFQYIVCQEGASLDNISEAMGELLQIS